MNIFFKEIKSNIKPFIFWSMGIFFLVVASMVKYSGLSSDVQVSKDLIDKFPKIVMALFGMANLDIMSLAGYYGVIFFFLIVMGAIYAMNLGVKSINFEINENTSEFIYTKPVSRRYITIMKILASICMMLLFVLISYGCSIVGIKLLGEENTINTEMILLNTSLVLIMLVYFSIGAFIASIKPKNANNKVSIIFLITYIISIIYDMIENNEMLRYFTPIKYFDINLVIMSKSLSAKFIVISIIISVFFTVLSVEKLNKMDL